MAKRDNLGNSLDATISADEAQNMGSIPTTGKISSNISRLLFF